MANISLNLKTNCLKLWLTLCIIRFTPELKDSLPLEPRLKVHQWNSKGKYQTLFSLKSLIQLAHFGFKSLSNHWTLAESQLKLALKASSISSRIFLTRKRTKLKLPNQLPPLLLQLIPPQQLQLPFKLLLMILNSLLRLQAWFSLSKMLPLMIQLPQLKTNLISWFPYLNKSLEPYFKINLQS